MTRQGALRHLEALQAAGLVETANAEHKGPGRPQHSYRLTASASAHLPNRDRALAGELVEFFQMGELERFFAGRSARLEAEYATQLAGLKGTDRVRELARLATSSGHLTEVLDGPGGLSLTHRNCPIKDVVARDTHPCQHEQDMYARLLDSKVERGSWQGGGDAACTYRIAENKGTQIG